MSKEEQLIKAAELAKDWSCWLVGLQTALISVIAIAVGKPHDAFFKVSSTGCLHASVVLFALSIAVATWILCGIPTIVQRISETTKDVFSVSLFSWLPVPLWVATTSQHWLFVSGIILFAFAVAFK